MSDKFQIKLRFTWSFDKYELRSHNDELKMFHKSENLGHSDLDLFVSLTLVQMDFCTKYKGSMTYHKGRTGKCRKKGKWFPSKNIGNFMLMSTTYVHMCAKYEFCMMKPVARRTVHRQRSQCQQQRRHNNYLKTFIIAKNRVLTHGLGNRLVQSFGKAAKIEMFPTTLKFIPK